MKKIILCNLLILALVSCGPSAEQKAAMEKAKLDSLAAYKELTTNQEKEISESVASKQSGYYLAMDFGLIQGEVFDFSPTDGFIGEMKCAGGEKPDEQIYIKIQEISGKITVLPCDYKTWLNLHKGDILK